MVDNYHLDNALSANRVTRHNTGMSHSPNHNYADSSDRGKSDSNKAKSSPSSRGGGHLNLLV